MNHTKLALIVFLGMCAAVVYLVWSPDDARRSPGPVGGVVTEESSIKHERSRSFPAPRRMSSSVENGIPVKSPALDVPSPDDLGAIHPDLPQAYLSGKLSNRADFGERINLRCLSTLPAGSQSVQWETIERYKPDGNGWAVLEYITVSPANMGQFKNSPYFACLERALRGNARFKLPTGFDDEVVVRNRGNLSFTPREAGDPKLAERLASLNEQAEHTEDEAMLKLLQFHIELAKCSLDHGSEYCLHEL